MASSYENMGWRIRQDLLYRLRWNILTALDNIEIVTGPHNEESVIPFFGNSSANESIAQPPLSRVEVSIGDCWSKRDYDYGDEEDRYKPPAALFIENADGSPISVGQFVTQVHAYLNENMEEIKKVKGEIYGKDTKWDNGTIVRSVTYGQPYLPPDIGIFFSQVNAPAIDGLIRLSVDLFAEGQCWISDDDFWATQLRQARRCEQKPQREQPTIESDWSPVPDSEIPSPSSYIKGLKERWH